MNSLDYCHDSTVGPTLGDTNPMFCATSVNKFISFWTSQKPVQSLFSSNEIILSRRKQFRVQKFTHTPPKFLYPALISFRQTFLRKL